MSDKTVLVNQYFDHVYVLNLARRSDRKKSMQKKLKQLGIKAEFINAVDGSKKEIREAYRAYLKIPLLLPDCHPLERALKIKVIDSPGAWGYLKTYLNLLKDAKKRKFQRILCLDDDAIFHHKFETLFSQNIQQLPTDWKLLYLGASQKDWSIPKGLSFPKENGNTQTPFYFPLATDGSFAVGIDSSIFDDLLTAVSAMNCTFDSGALMSIVNKFPTACYVLFPNLIIADLSESDIRGGKDVQEWANYYKWNLSDYDRGFQKLSYQILMQKVKRKINKYRARITS